MCITRVNAHFNMSHHGPLHLFKDTIVVVDSLTGIHKVGAKCLFVVNWGSKVSQQVEIQRIQI